MGRPRKTIEIQKKHLTKEEKQIKKISEESIKIGSEELLITPFFLVNNIAKDEYERIVKDLLKIEVVGNLDRNNIAIYCNIFANYIEITEKIKKVIETNELIIEKETRDGINKTINPLIKLQKMTEEQLLKFASTIGMTIDSRLKVAIQKTTEIKLELENEFNI